MTRRQWIGLAGLLFGVAMAVGIFLSGSTPDTSDPDAAARYTKHWADTGNQDSSLYGSLVLTYAIVLLVAFAAGLRHLLRRLDDGPLPSLVIAGGVAGAALIGAGAGLLNAPGVAGTESDVTVDGNTALVMEAAGYFTVITGIMCAAFMAVCFAISNRTARVVPQWTAVLAGLLGLGALGSGFTAWSGFMLLPAYAVIMGVVLLATKDSEDAPADAAYGTTTA